MLRPNQRKYRKSNKGKLNSSYETKANQLQFGIIGLQSLEKGRITARQIEAVRRSLAGFTKRKSKTWIRIFPDFPVSKKPTEVRMGRGKGNVSHWVSIVKPGRILYEMAGSDVILLKAALKNASVKLPVSTRIIERQLF